MKEQNEVLRIIISTGRILRADVLAECLSTLDGLVTRIITACQISELLRRYNEELSQIQAMGLMAPGTTPDQWNRAERGTDAITRQEYLKTVTSLRQHGIVVRQDHLGWGVDFDFDDIIQLAPRAQHLEIDFIHIASPGVASFIQSGSNVLKEADGFLRHIFDRWTEPELSKRLMEAHVKIKEHEARVVEENANQAALKTQMLQAVVNEIQNGSKSIAPAAREVTLDVSHRLDGLRGTLMAGGLTLKKADSAVLRPIADGIDKLARLVCDEFITGIASVVDSCEDQKDSSN